MRIAVFASGGGTNLQSLIDHLHGLGERAPGAVTLVVSDRESAGALERARAAGVAAVHLPAPTPDGGVATLLAEHRIDLVVLAGYLKLVPAGVARAYDGRIVNVHPALLPAFGGYGMYGRRVHQAVLSSGARVTGVTVHFVNAEYDRGAIIAQWPVPVRADDTAEALAARVLQVEHDLYPRVIAAVCAGTVTLDGDGRARGWTDPPQTRFALA